MYLMVSLNMQKTYLNLILFNGKHLTHEINSGEGVKGD
jgi:hypothetical protein